MHKRLKHKSYAIATHCFAGIIYDVIVEPPSIGSTTDEKGNSKPVSKLPPQKLKKKHKFLKYDEN